MKKLLTATTITAISLFSIAGVADVHAELGTTSTPTRNVEISSTGTPTTTVINKLLTTVQKEESTLSTRFKSIQQKADQFITRRITSIQNTISKLESSKEASASDTVAEVTALQQEITGLTSLKSQIDTMTYTDASSITSLKSLATQVFTNYRVYCEALPKAYATEHLDQLNNIMSNSKIVTQYLADDVSYAQSQGKSTTTITNDEEKYNTDAAKLATDLASAKSLVSSLSPSSCTGTGVVYTQLKSVFATLHKDVLTNKEDLEIFTKDFRALFDLNTTPTGTVKGTTTPTE